MNSEQFQPKKRAQERYTAQQVIAALRITKGMTTLAARRLGCDHKTVQRYIREYESVAQALREEREAVTDAAELALYKAIQDGQPWAVCFYLKTQGRERGYVEKQQLEHSGRVTIDHTVARALDVAYGERTPSPEPE